MQCLRQGNDIMDSPQQPACCRVSLTEICSLYQRLFQTPADINSVQAAVDQVCGVRLHSTFCCSSRLLDVLVEIERRRWVKEQVYWDFQLLDFNKESSLSLSDVKILLQRAQESQITSMSWVDFLTQRQETSGRVTWPELELDRVQYANDLGKEKMRLKRQWDSGGVVDIVRATEETDNERRYYSINQEDLAEAVEFKYAVLREKLFYDMLQAHYGAQVWASMDAGQKEKNLNEFKMLAQFGLEKGSELVLSQLPGATYNFREEDSNYSQEEVSQTWTGVRGLKELQRRLELEQRTVASIAGGGSSSISMEHQYFLLFVQTNKARMECNFSAAMLVVEPHWEQRFWDGTPLHLETCYEELAHIRLTNGQRINSTVDKPSLQKMPMQEDKLFSLLKRQEEARDLLFQLLQSCSHKELQEPLSNLLHNKSEEFTHPIEEVSGNKVARNPLRDLFLLAMTVTKTCLQEDHGVVTWGDCAVRLLVQVQLKQELEMRELIQELVNGLNSDWNIDHQTIPSIMEERDTVSDLIHLLQPLTPQEQLDLKQLNIKHISDHGDPNIEKDSSIKEHYTTKAETDIRVQTDNKSALVLLDSTNEKNADKINNYSIRKQKAIQERIGDGHHYRQSNTDYRNTVTDSSSQTEYTNRPEVLEGVRNRNDVCRGIKSEESIVHRKDATEILSRGPRTGIHPIRHNDICGTDEKNINTCEQVPQNQLATSVLEATEGLIAGLMALKVRVEQVYMMRETERNPFQKSPKNITKECPLDTQVTSMEQNKPKHCNEIYCSNEGKDTQTNGCEIHQDSVKHMKTGTVQKRQKEEEIPEKQSITNIHGSSGEISSEQVASAVMEAAEHLIGSLKTLKEEISRASQSQITKQGGIASTADGYKYLEDPQENTRTEKPPPTQGKYKAIKEGQQKNEKSLEEEAVQTLEDDLPHVPEPLIREVSWEVHPECSKGCSHTKLWDSDPDSEHISGKNLEIEKIEKNPGNIIDDFIDNDEKMQSVRLLIDPHTQRAYTEKECSRRKDRDAGKHDMDHEEGDQNQHVLITKGDHEEPAEYSSINQKEHAKDAISSLSLMANSLKYDCSETDSADKLALSFLEAAQNLIGGLIPGKEEALGRVVVILTDGNTKDGDIILDQGEEFSDASGTISVLEGSSGEEFQDPGISKKNEESVGPNLEPIISEKVALWEMNRDCVDQCADEHFTNKTNMRKQLEMPQIQKMSCHLEGCGRIVRTALERLQNTEDEEEIIISTTEESSNEGLCKEANDPGLLRRTINANNEEGISDHCTGTEIGMGDDTDCNVREETFIDVAQYFDRNGNLESSETVDQEQRNELNEAISFTSVAYDKEDTEALTENEVENGIMKTTINTNGEEDSIHTISSDHKESEASSTDIQYANERRSICKEHLENKAEEYTCTAEEDMESVKPKDTESIEEHTDLLPDRLSPDTLVRSVLLATEDLIGSLTSLKDSMGNNVKTKSLSASDNIFNTSSVEQTHDQISAENIFGGDNQLCATLEAQGNKKLTVLDPLNITSESEKPEELTWEPDNNVSLKENKNPQCTPEHQTEESDEIQHGQPSEQDSGGNSTTINIDNLPADIKSHNLLQGNSEDNQNNTYQRMAENEGTKESALVPSVVGVSVPPWNLPWNFTCASLEPNLVDQDNTNLNKWRSISEKQLLKSCISEILKIEVIEKSKSDSVSYQKRLELPLRVIPGMLEPDKGNADASCIGNKDPKTEELTLTTTKEDNEKFVMSNENIEKKSEEPDLNSPAVLTHLKQMGTVCNEDEIQHNETQRKNVSMICQSISEMKTKSKLVQEMTTDQIHKRNIQVQESPEMQGTQRNEKENNTEYSMPSNLCSDQIKIFNKDEEKETRTTICDFLQDDQHVGIMTKSQVLQEQAVSSVPLGETMMNISSEDILRNPESCDFHKEDATKETKTSYNILEVYPQHNLSNLSNSNVIPERSKGPDLDSWFKDSVDEHVMAKEKKQGEENSKTEKSDSTDIKDMSDMYNLRKLIKKEVTKWKSDNTEEKEEAKQSCSHIDMLFECETVRTKEKGELLDADRFTMGSRNPADNLLENTEAINKKYCEKPQTLHTESQEEMYLMNSKMNENKEQKDNYRQEKHDQEDVRGVKQVTSQWMELKEEASQTLAETVQTDDIWNDVAQVPANGTLVRNEAQLPCSLHTCQQLHMLGRTDRLQDILHLKPCTVDGNAPPPLGQVALQREKVFIRLSLREQQEALQRLRDLQREAELKCTSDRRRQMLRFQERLSIARNRKSEVDLMDITQRRSPQMTPEPVAEGDSERQKSAVRERLEKMKRERTYIMQTRRDRNMSSFRELLDPVLAKNKSEDSGSELKGTEGMS